MRSESSAPEDEIDKLLAKLRVGVSAALRPTLDSLEHQITRLSTGINVLNTWGDGPATDPTWFHYGLTPFEVRTMIAIQKAGPPGITKERLMAGVYFQETNDWPELKILDIRIHHIRNKLLAAKAPWWIETVWGMGWVLHEGAKEPRKNKAGDNLWNREPTPSSRRQHGQRSKARQPNLASGQKHRPAK